MDLNNLAPYPSTEQEATADSMARWLTLSAYVRHHQDVRPARRDWENAGRPDNGLYDALLLATQAFTAEYGLAYLLREVPLSKADGLAREVWRAYDSDDRGAAEALGSWLADEEGIDVGLVHKLIDAEEQDG